MNFIFKVIVILYQFSLICPLQYQSNKHFSFKLFKFLLIITSNILITVLYILCKTTFALRINLSLKHLPFILMNVTEVVYRWILIKEMGHLRKLVSKLELLRSKEPERKSMRFMYYAFVTLTVLLQVILFILYVLTIPTYLKTIKITSFTSALDEKHERIIGAAYTLFKYIFFMAPIYTFTLFYVTACYQIRISILNFAKTVTLNVDDKYDILSHSYSSIRSTVEFVDHHTSLLVFCSTTYCFSYMFHFISQNVLRDKLSSITQTMYSSCVFLNILSSFVAMTVSASLVREASLEVGDATRRLLQSRRTPTFDFKKFLLNAEREINLTVWKIVPINRSFILGTIGAMFTYVMIFDSIK